jgi:predicted nucleotidyltransferase
LPLIITIWYYVDMNRTEILTRLKSVEPQLRALGVAGLYVFGSYAREEAREDSDLDVFVDKAPGTQFHFDDFMGAYQVLAEAVPVKIDYGTRDGLSKFIRADVEREAIRVF